jgi:hypothetical protein
MGREMALLAHSIGFGEPGGDFVIDFVDPRETEGVQMISPRESFDAAETRILEATRQDHVAVHPVSPNDEGRETHPDLEGDPRFLRENLDRPVLLRDRQQFIEDGAHVRRFIVKMGSERGSPAGVRLISIRELPPAIRAAPQRSCCLTHLKIGWV